MSRGDITESQKLANSMISQAFEEHRKSRNFKPVENEIKSGSDHEPEWEIELTLKGYRAPEGVFYGGKSTNKNVAKIKARKSYLHTLDNWDETITELLLRDNYIVGEKIPLNESQFLELKGKATQEPMTKENILNFWTPRKEGQKGLGAYLVGFLNSTQSDLARIMYGVNDDRTIVGVCLTKEDQHDVDTKFGEILRLIEPPLPSDSITLRYLPVGKLKDGFIVEVTVLIEPRTDLYKFNNESYLRKFNSTVKISKNNSESLTIIAGETILNICQLNAGNSRGEDEAGDDKNDPVLKHLKESIVSSVLLYQKLRKAHLLTGKSA